MLIDGKKVACATCIKGHRATHCKHKDRPMVEIKQKGRPKTQCKRCRELRLVRQLHVKCNCGDGKELKRNRSTISSKNEQEARMIKKFVTDLSNTNLRAIAPRPREFQQQPEQQPQVPVHGADLSFSSTSHVISPYSPSPPQYTSYPSLSSSSPLPSLLSPQQSSPFPPSRSPPSSQYSTFSLSQPSASPPPLLSSHCNFSYPTSSTGDSSNSISSATATSLSASSVCRCRPGNSCGCKKSDGNTSSCCGSSSTSSQSSILPSKSSNSSSSCCGSSSKTSTSTTASSSCYQSSPTSSLSPSSSSLPPLRQPVSEKNTSAKSTSCCASTSTAPSSAIPSYDTNMLLDPPTQPSSPPSQHQQLSPQSMLQPSVQLLTLANGRMGTMCEDGIGKSSCCSTKQRNALGEIIRVVTCRCGDDCACIGCDAHPSRAMKSSQQDPYAGYTDLSLGRRRLSIAAICSGSSSSSNATMITAPITFSSSTISSSPTSSPPPPPPPLLQHNHHQHQQDNSASSSSSSSSSSMDHPSTPRYETLNKLPSSTSKMNDIPTSVLGEDGISLCGCGCNNTLDECTDCFQELCQDYYSGR